MLVPYLKLFEIQVELKGSVKYKEAHVSMGHIPLLYTIALISNKVNVLSLPD